MAFASSFFGLSTREMLEMLDEMHEREMSQMDIEEEKREKEHQAKMAENRADFTVTVAKEDAKLKVLKEINRANAKVQELVADAKKEDMANILKVLEQRDETESDLSTTTSSTFWGKREEITTRREKTTAPHAACTALIYDVADVVVSIQPAGLAIEN